jgi:hypothetical protein
MPDSCEYGWIAVLIRKEGPVIGRSYEIRVVGSLGPAARAAFTDVAVEVEPTATVLWGDLDQVRLHALLDRVRSVWSSWTSGRSRTSCPGDTLRLLRRDPGELDEFESE